MKEEFDISTFRPDSVGELASFLKEEYPSGEISDEKYLAWEYLGNPFGSAIVSTARNEEKKIISQYALAPMIVQVDGTGTLATLSLNTLTAEEYRGKGLFQSTANETFNYCAANEVAFTYGIPNSNSFPGFIRRLKFIHAGNLVFMARPLKPIKVFSAMMNRRNKKKGESIVFIPDENELKNNSVSELIFPTDEKRYNDFLSHWDKQISIQRTPEYLNWRYVQNPLRKYTIFKLMVGDEIKAIAVIRAMHLYGLKVCLIMDHISLDKSHSINLLNAITGQAKENNMELMIAVAASKRNNQYIQLRNGGFWPVPEFLLPQQLPFITKIHNNFDALMTKLNDLRNWHFSFGDYDVF